MLRRVLPEKKRTGAVPVYLNVYDLTPINGYAYWFGLGVYHSGVQVHGVEYAFGSHENSGTGVFEVEPKHCPGFIFRKSILIGRTDMSSEEFCNFMEDISQEYAGNTYHLITRNCNHFCNDVCIKLTGKAIPRWVNRLARLGLFCNCVLPVAINKSKSRQVRQEDNGVIQEDMEKTSGLLPPCEWPSLPPQPFSPCQTNIPKKDPPLSPIAKGNSKKDSCFPSPSWLSKPASKLALV